MRTVLSRLIAIVLVVFVAVGSVGCGANVASTLTGDYSKDTIALIDTMRDALNLPDGSDEQASAQAQARQIINDYAARYRRDPAASGLASFTTVRTALNSLAGHYASYPNRPVPQKLKDRLEREFKQVELALRRGS